MNTIIVPPPFRICRSLSEGGTPISVASTFIPIPYSLISTALSDHPPLSSQTNELKRSRINITQPSPEPSLWEKRKKTAPSLSIRVGAEHCHSMYTIESEKITKHNSIQIDDLPPIRLELIGFGTFSNVFILAVDSPTQLHHEAANDQIVIKILHAKHCGIFSLESRASGSPVDSSVIMIENAVAHHHKLQKLFQFKEADEIPLVKFYNPHTVLLCGFSIYEKAIPMDRAPPITIWDPTRLFEDLTEQQKKTYNSILELILLDKLHNELTDLLNKVHTLTPSGPDKDLYLDLISQQRLDLDLKWNNFGFRQRGPENFQLLLIDDANTPVEHGIEKSLLNTETLCSGPADRPNPHIAKALTEKQVALLDSKSTSLDPYYHVLNSSLALIASIQTISHRLDHPEDADTRPVSDQINELIQEKERLLG